MKPPIEYRKPRYEVSVGPKTKIPKSDPHFVEKLIPILYEPHPLKILAHKRALKAAQMRRWRANKKAKK